MLLKEFFGKTIDPVKMVHRDRDDQGVSNDLFHYILDHDKLHKDYFYPIAQKIKHECSTGKENKDKLINSFMPMVKKGCKEYYAHKKLKGHIGKIFSEELRKDMCERLYDHFKEDILKDKYQLGT